MTEIVRSVHDIATEIISIKDFTRSTVLHGSIEIGRRLVEAKSLLQHGEWGNWLEESVDYSQSTANNLMRICEEYGGSNSQTFRNLSYSQAVALLAVPADEREQFAEQNEAENLSTRELQQAIKDKQEAVKRAEAAEMAAEDERQATAKLQSNLDELIKKSDAYDKELNRLHRELETARADGDDEAEESLQETLDAANGELATSRNRIKELEEQLKMPIEVSAIVEKVPDTIQAELDQLRSVQKSSKQLAKFSVIFESQVKGFNDLLDALDGLGTTDPEAHAKAKTAVTGLIGKMSERL